MNQACVLRTGRLVLTPVSGTDLVDLCAFKSDPSVFAIMLGGVRSRAQVVDDLAREVQNWGRYGFGFWAIRENGHFRGLTGLEHRPDGLGVALRFALESDAQGRGLAREAAAATLHFGHQMARLPRIVAVARESNFGSRQVLGGIGMREVETFVRNGWTNVLYESVRRAL